MKKLALFLGLLSLISLVKASDSDLYDIYVSSQGTVSNTTRVITIDFPDKGVQSCITKITWQATGFPSTGLTLSILNGGATYYQIMSSTFVPPIIDYWDYQNALCLQPGVTTYVQISTTSSYNLNLVGYARSKRE